MQQPCQPQRRITDLSLQHVANETLVYDELAHKAYCLNEVAATVWNLLDGTRTPQQISAAATAKLSYAVSEDVVMASLAQFEADGLLVTAAAPVFVETGMLSRRRLMVAMAAGAVVMLPIVHPVMTASAAQTYNGCVDCSATSGQTSGAQKTTPTKSNSTGTPLFNDDVK